MRQPGKPVFVVALRTGDDASGLARLLEDVQLPEQPAVFTSPEVRGSEYIRTLRGRCAGFSWQLGAGVPAVYLLDHEPGLAALIRGLPGTFYIGLPDDASAGDYDALSATSVITFLTSGPLDFATVIMRDYSRPPVIVFDEHEALLMAALSSDFPDDLDDSDFDFGDLAYEPGRTEYPPFGGSPYAQDSAGGGQNAPEAAPSSGGLLELREGTGTEPRLAESALVGPDRFYGRSEEQGAFRKLLGDLISAPPSTAAGSATSPVVLISGIGGIGKTSLSARLCDIARSEYEFSGRVRVVALDWDDHKEGASDLAATIGSADTARGLLGIIASAFGPDPRRSFRRFYRAAGQIRQAEDRARKQLPPGTREPSPLAAIGLAGAQLLISSAVPPGIAGLLNVTVDQLPALSRQAKAWLERVRPEDRDMILDGGPRLTEAFAADLRAASRERPIVLAQDTYEIAAWADDRCLQRLYQQTGPRVAWILAARFTEGQRRSYAVSWPNGGVISFDLGKLNRLEIRTFFTHAAPERPVTRQEIEVIARATGGVPVAVAFAAGMWRGGASLELIAGTGDIGDLGDGDLAAVMIDRFLKYARQDQSRPLDYDRLCCLALLPDRTDRPGIEDADLLAVLWGVDQVGPVLEELAARYEFVLSRRLVVRDGVREPLRQHLLTAVSRRDLRARNRPAIDYLAARLDDRQQQLETLEARVFDDDWQKTVLALAWHRFWDSYESGWATVVAALPAAIEFDPGFGNALLALADRFAATASQMQQRSLEMMRGCLSEPYPASRVDERVLDELSRPRRPAAGAQPDDGCMAEVAAILALRKVVRLTTDGQPRGAISYLDEAVRKVPEVSKLLRGHIAADVERVALRLVWSPAEESLKASEAGLDLALLAVKLTPHDGDCWITLGMARWASGSYQDAIAAYRRAADADPCWRTYNDLGVALGLLDRSEDAAIAFERAIEFGGGAAARVNRSIQLSRLGREYEAAACCDQAISDDPGYAPAHTQQAIILLGSGDLVHAETAALQATQLESDNEPWAWLIAGAIAKCDGEAAIARQRLSAALTTSEAASGLSRFARAEIRVLADICLGNGDRALETLRQALPGRLPGDCAPAQIADLIARCAVEPGRLDEARALLAR